MKKPKNAKPVYQNVVILDDESFCTVGPPSLVKKYPASMRAFVQAAWDFPVRTMQVATLLEAKP